MGGDDSGLLGVKRVILVLSGKGGVGKSTVATQLAFAFQQAGQKVGILDIDLCGPSVPKMLGLQSKQVYQCDQGWVPVFTDESQTLGVMSIGNVQLFIHFMTVLYTRWRFENYKKNYKKK